MALRINTSNSFAEVSKKLMARAKDIKERVESMRGKKIVVGIPESAEYPNGKSVAAVADLITYGIKEDGDWMQAGPRPFIREAASENGQKWSRRIQDGVRAELRAHKRGDIQGVLQEVGETMVEDIREKMLEMEVYDTGKMYNSISVLQVNNKVLSE